MYVYQYGDARSVMVIIVVNGQGDPSSNPRRYYPWEMYASRNSSSSYGKIVGQTVLLNPGMATNS